MGKITIKKEIVLDCAHKLTKSVSEDHKCHGLHGHTYFVTLEVSSEKAATHSQDMVIDFGVLSQVVKDTFDHKYLNNVFKDLGVPGDTTVENLACVIADIVNLALLTEDSGRVGATSRGILESVRVQEGASGVAIWTRE